jgi:hypothetical protein
MLLQRFVCVASTQAALRTFVRTIAKELTRRHPGQYHQFRSDITTIITPVLHKRRPLTSFRRTTLSREPKPEFRSAAPAPPPMGWIAVGVVIIALSVAPAYAAEIRPCTARSA